MAVKRKAAKKPAQNKKPRNKKAKATKKKKRAVQTTFNVYKQQTVGYRLGKNGSKGTALVLYETRHNTGNLLVELLAKQNIDINTLVNSKGEPKVKLINFLRGAITTEKKSLLKK